MLPAAPPSLMSDSVNSLLIVSCFRIETTVNLAVISVKYRETYPLGADEERCELHGLVQGAVPKAVQVRTVLSSGWVYFYET